MKVYVVTTGCYSDYTISKIFTDKDKAKEYKEWLYDSNDIEEYETEDDLEVKKFYKIYVNYDVYDNKVTQPLVQVFKCCGFDVWQNYTWYTAYDGSGLFGCHIPPHFQVSITRYIPAENFNEEFHRNKYIKAVYDLAAIAKQKRIEGASEKDIQMLFSNMEE